jgi:hypothetical protein
MHDNLQVLMYMLTPTWPEKERYKGVYYSSSNTVCKSGIL